MSQFKSAQNFNIKSNFIKKKTSPQNILKIFLLRIYFVMFSVPSFT